MGEQCIISSRGNILGASGTSDGKRLGVALVRKIIENFSPGVSVGFVDSQLFN